MANTSITDVGAIQAGGTGNTAVMDVGAMQAAPAAAALPQISTVGIEVAAAVSVQPTAHPVCTTVLARIGGLEQSTELAEPFDGTVWSGVAFERPARICE